MVKNISVTGIITIETFCEKQAIFWKNDIFAALNRPRHDYTTNIELERKNSL